jgi:LysM repeat protein
VSKSKKSASNQGRTTTKTVVVKRGDTLHEIATRNGTTVAELRRVNGLKTSRVRTGQKIKIPTS